MTKPLTASNKDELSSPTRRLMLAACASLAVTASFVPWITCSAPGDGPQGDLFAFTAPTKRDLVFALALSPRPFGQNERDPLTVRLHAGASSWTVGPFGLQNSEEARSDGMSLFCGRVWRNASNGVGEKAHLIAIATPGERMPTGSLAVWAEIFGKRGVRWRIGNPVVSHLMAEDARLAQVHATLHPAMDVEVLSAAIARHIAARRMGGLGFDSQARAKRLAALILPDTLQFDPARPSGYTFAAINGRRADDVIGRVVQTLLVGAPGPAREARCYRAAGQFPYFAKAV
jgi:hypothetical protein